MKTQLQRIRKERGFTSASAFAEHLGMSTRTYTNYEQGVTSLTLEKAWEFADALECTLDELAGREFDAKKYYDARQALLNEDFAELSDAGKDAACGAVRGIRAQENTRAKSAGLKANTLSASA